MARFNIQRGDVMAAVVILLAVAMGIALIRVVWNFGTRLSRPDQGKGDSASREDSNEVFHNQV
jgi:hypothetical protein